MAGTTGGEKLEPRDEFREEIVGRQHQGEAALVQGDVRPRLAMWSHTDPVSLFAAVGPTVSESFQPQTLTPLGR